jgi:hypothetical protein
VTPLEHAGAALARMIVAADDEAERRDRNPERRIEHRRESRQAISDAARKLIRDAKATS